MRHSDRRPRSPSASRQGGFAPAPKSREQSALPGDAAKFVKAAIHEPQFGSRDHVSNGGRDEDLARSRQASQASANVNRNAAKPAILEFALAGVETGPNLEAEFDDLVVERARERHRVGRDIERRQEPIARGIDLAPTEPPEPLAEAGMVRPQELGPRPIAEFKQPPGRVDDVGEQDRCEHASGEGLEVLEPPSIPDRMVHLGTDPSLHRSRMPRSAMRACLE